MTAVLLIPLGQRFCGDLFAVQFSSSPFFCRQALFGLDFLFAGSMNQNSLSWKMYTYLQIAEALGVTLNDLFYDTADCLSSRLLSSYEDQLSMLTEYERNVVTQVTESTIDIMLQLRKIAK